MLKINKVVIISLFIIFSQLPLMAQNNTNSPYTRYGYGELADRSFGAGRAMGGIGYGLRSSKQINPLNPASYSCMDSLTFLFDIGVAGQLSWFDDSFNRQKNINGNIEYLALQFPIKKWLAMSAGLLPYSYVGYDFGSDEPDIDSDGNPDPNRQSRRLYNGTGGLNQLYAGISVDLWKKRLAIGANFSYLFGNITHERTVTPIIGGDEENPSPTTVAIYQKTRVSDIKMDFGVQYTHPFTAKERLTVGATYSPKQMLSNKVYYSKQDYQTSSSGSTSIVGSESDTTKNVPMGLPNSYGVGFTYVKDNKFTVGADVLYEQWKKVDFPWVDKNSYFDNRLRVAAGGEITPKYMGKNYLGKISYRAGGHYSNSYLKINGEGYKEYGASVGFGFPMPSISGHVSMLNVTFEYVKVKPQIKTMIDEQYFRFTLNYTFNELWFRKWKLE
ncbi:hypothetical protein [Parabacteroides pacaensis]|uniref:hypothetical protein n=1 Tax=Parabacteroides pacaensis TaxID=2086575 RepID=UPI000D0E81F5|nr:hypothetical protein [Parabacteroides pacaensis]